MKNAWKWAPVITAFVALIVFAEQSHAQEDACTLEFRSHHVDPTRVQPGQMVTLFGHPMVMQLTDSTDGMCRRAILLNQNDAKARAELAAARLDAEHARAELASMRKGTPLDWLVNNVIPLACFACGVWGAFAGLLLGIWIGHSLKKR